MKLLKNLTSLTMILALLSLHIETGAIAWSSAYARDDEQPRFQEVDLPNITNESNNVVNQTNQASAPTLDYNASACKIGDMTVNQFMLMVTLLLGPTIGISCITTISGKVFSAAVAIYLIKEILNYTKYSGRKTSDQTMLAKLDFNNSDTQIDAFLLAAQQETDAAEALKARANNAKLLSTLLYASATVAAVEYVVSWAQYGACVASTIGTGVCPCGIGTAIPDRCGPPRTACESPPERSIMALRYVPDLSGMMVAYNINSSKQYACYSRSEQNLYELEAFIAFHEKNSAIPPASILSNDNKNEKNLTAEQFFNDLLNGLISSTNAKESEDANQGGILSGLGISGAVAGIVAAFVLKKQMAIQAALSAGWVRALIFGGLGFFAGAAARELEDATKCAENNSDTYKNLAAQLERALSSKSRLAGGAPDPRGIDRRVLQLRKDRDELNGPNSQALCMIGKSGEYRVDPKCACKKDNTCATAKFDTTKFSSLSLPASFGTSMGAMSSGAGSLFSGNTAAADSAFGTLGANAANMRSIRKKALEKGLAELVKDKKLKPKSLDINKFDEASSNFLEKMVQPSVNKINSLSPALAKSSSSGTFLGSSNSLSDDAKKGDMKELLASIKSNSAGGINKGDNAPGEFKFDFADEANPGAGTGTEDMALSQGDALNEFKSNESDISDRPDENIFNIITVRYFKSAYPRFFNEGNKEKESLD